MPRIKNHSARPVRPVTSVERVGAHLAAVCSDARVRSEEYYLVFSGEY